VGEEYFRGYGPTTRFSSFSVAKSFLSAVGPSIDIIAFGDDLGMQTGPQISPRMYREFFKPRHARLWSRAKELANVKVMLHCCGGVRELLPDLIEAGLDAINPVQISCRGMEPVIEELASSLAGRVRVAKLNVDRSPEATARLRIQGVPTVLVFKDGREVTRMIGERGKGELMRALVGVV